MECRALIQKGHWRGAGGDYLETGTEVESSVSRFV